MSEPETQGIDAYDASTFSLVLGELADVIRASGFAAEHLVVIGGMVPGLLVPVPEAGGDPHIGTTDLDLCLSVALLEGDTAEYERLEKAITRIGFEPGDASFRWVRSTGLRMTLEFFCPASEDRPAGASRRPRVATNPRAKHNFGGRLSALALNAGSVLVEDVQIVVREVQLPDGKGTVSMQFRVTGPLAFLVAKKEALVGRDKPKDSYDIIWLLENWPGGPHGAAEAILARASFNHETRLALAELRALFADEDQLGAASYARFVGSSRDRLMNRRRAVGAVAEFLDAIENAVV